MGANQGDQIGDAQRQRFGPLHGQPLGHQLAEDEGDVGEDQGDDHHGHGIQGGGGEGDAEREQPLGQPGRKIVRSKGTAQKAGEGNGHLNGSQKTGGLADQPGEPDGPAVPLRGQLLQLHIVHGDHGDLSAGENSV